MEVLEAFYAYIVFFFCSQMSMCSHKHCHGIFYKIWDICDSFLIMFLWFLLFQNVDLTWRKRKYDFVEDFVEYSAAKQSRLSVGSKSNGGIQPFFITLARESPARLSDSEVSSTYGSFHANETGEQLIFFYFREIESILYIHKCFILNSFA